MEECISRLHSRPLPHDQPLWGIYLINGYQDRQIVFWRFHHALGDGVSWSAATVALLTDKIDVELVSATLFQRLVVLLWVWWGWAFVLLRWLRMAIWYPPQSKLVTHGKPLSGQRHVALDAVCSVERAKAIGRPCGATVNDVMMAALARAVSNLNGGEESWLATAVPVNLRLSTLHVLELANVFGSISMFLPISSKGALADTVRLVKKETAAAKRFPEAHVGYVFLIIASAIFPTRLTRFIFDALSSKVKLSFSNVKGIDEKLTFFDGVECSLMAGIVPPPNGVGIGVGVVSFGKV